MHQGLSKAHEESLASYAKDNLHVEFYEMSDALLKPIQDRKENYLRGDFFTMSIFTGSLFQTFSRNMTRPFTSILTRL